MNVKIYRLLIAGDKTDIKPIEQHHKESLSKQLLRVQKSTDATKKKPTSK